MNQRQSMSAVLTSLVAAAGLFAAAAAHAEVPLKTADGVLVDAQSRTVYTFDNDVAGSGKSVCNGQCATAWPPVMADAGAKAEGNYSIVTRDDGMKQWAYKGKPLYLFVKDAAAGDKKGDGVKDVWHVVKP
ncbi:MULTISPECIES: hypothetical protein [Pandoraea]|uniref:Lipoprotein n=1 Tax=Pandoraea capi TaxID=2508286 RepID=A0ABY6VMR1_9BURK|nr:MULTISPECIES: hypothetical protein [Pandoraea]MCI3204158.1 hypothetical protein [Pandoraea sp. LA3]MDN4582184.1 hypothetical protein [Pandoraea capi]VVD65932.1 lipoprotein [Pandoraea capi]